jgi:hypothetical protein
MDIHLERFAHRIWMCNVYRQDIKERAAVFPGANWATAQPQISWARGKVGPRGYGAWTFPLTYRGCMDLRKEFNDAKIHIGERLWRWASAERQRRRELAQILAMDEMPTPRLEATYPDLAAAVHSRKFQSVGIGYLCRARQAIIGDDPGLGKTLQTAGAAVELGLAGPHLVLGPSSAIEITWPDEFGEWLPDEPFWVIEGDKNKRANLLQDFWDWSRDHPDSRAWAFCNKEMLQNERPPVRRKFKKLEMPEGFNKKIWEKREAERFLVFQDEESARMEAFDPESRRFEALFDITWSAAFVDESHRLLPTKTSEVKKQPQTRSGVQRLAVRTRGLKIAMSGTPWRGNPVNNWGTLNWLWPDQYPGYWSYVDRWFDVQDGDFKVIGDVRADTEKEFGVELDAVMIRRRKSEVAKDLPPKEYGGTRLYRGDSESPVGIWLPMRGKQSVAYESMVADALAHLDSGTLVAGGVLAELTRCKQFACSYGDIREVRRKIPRLRVDRLLASKRERIAEELGLPLDSPRVRRVDLTDEELYEWMEEFYPTLPSNKLDWIRDFLAERGITKDAESWGEDKVVIASQYTTIINMFVDQLTKEGIACHKLTGQQNSAERRKAKSEFQSEGGPRVFFLNIDAGGTSLTLDAADDLVFIDEKWIPDDQTQVEDRIHRLSRMHQVRIWYLRSRGTIDERIAVQTAHRDNVQLRLLDGRRGVDYAKRLLVPESAMAA